VEATFIDRVRSDVLKEILRDSDRFRARKGDVPRPVERMR
jgi:hypothetical protein